MDRFVATVTSVLAGLLFSFFPAFGADLSSTDLSALNQSRKITLIHMGDIHGHLVAQPNLRSDSSGLPEGGLARLYTKIKEIRKTSLNTFLINTGDTIQGSAEALYTCGQAVVDVLNLFHQDFHIDAFAPGNWDFVYGNNRFRELFGGSAPDGPAVVCPQSPGTPPLAPWTALAANAYRTSVPCGTGSRILPPYVVKSVGGVRVGVLGFTTDRGPQVVGTNITQGICFTKGDAEVTAFIPILRNVEHVDLLVMVSELGLANNIRLAEAHPGIDVILSSDMHERTPAPVVTSTGTVIVEEGDGGTMLGELEIKLKSHGIKEWTWTAHIINSTIAENPTIAAKVAEVRKTFVSGPDFCQPTEACAHVNPFNGTRLQAPIDTVVGYTTIPLHRANFSNEPMPAVIEGSSHDFLTDAFRVMAGADIGAIRGFRYGTHVAPVAPDGGPGLITLADLYNFIPIGPLIAKGTVSGAAVKSQIEGAADGALNPDVSLWTGGWLFNFAGLTMDVNPYGGTNGRASNIMVLPWGTETPVPLVPLQSYTYASYFYASDPTLVNRTPATNITVVTDIDGVTLLDGTEVVARYLQLLPNQTVTADVLGPLPRNRLAASNPSLCPLPPPSFVNPEFQPLRGVPVVPGIPVLCPPSP